MNMWAKIGWGALGFLVLTSVAVMFLLHWTMGLFFACFVAVVLWWVFGVLKKKVDMQIQKAADTLSLVFKPHPFRYAAMEGEYKGLPVRISYESSRTFGLGSALVTSGHSPAWAALDARNVTVLNLKHGLSCREKKAFHDAAVPIILRKEKLITFMDGVCTHPRLLKNRLDALIKKQMELTEKE